METGRRGDAVRHHEWRRRYDESGAARRELLLAVTRIWNLSGRAAMLVDPPSTETGGLLWRVEGRAGYSDPQVRDLGVDGLEAMVRCLRTIAAWERNELDELPKECP